jgi:hypothetical protein
VEATGGRAHYIDGATEPYNCSARHAPVMKSRLGDNRLKALVHQTGRSAGQLHRIMREAGRLAGFVPGLRAGINHDRRAFRNLFRGHNHDLVAALRLQSGAACSKA